MAADSAKRGGGRRSPASMIASQLRTLARDHARVQLKRERAWASITFSGTRYCFSIEWPAATDALALQELTRILPGHEFDIPGYFVADIVITDQSEFQLRVEILSIRDPVEALPDS